MLEGEHLKSDAVGVDLVTLAGDGLCCFQGDLGIRIGRARHIWGGHK